VNKKEEALIMAELKEFIEAESLARHEADPSQNLEPQEWFDQMKHMSLPPTPEALVDIYKAGKFLTEADKDQLLAHAYLKTPAPGRPAKTKLQRREERPYVYFAAKDTRRIQRVMKNLRIPGDLDDAAKLASKKWSPNVDISEQVLATLNSSARTNLTKDDD
jgi:hypothetical protein